MHDLLANTHGEQPIPRPFHDKPVKRSYQNDRHEVEVSGLLCSYSLDLQHTSTAFCPETHTYLS